MVMLMKAEEFYRQLVESNIQLKESQVSMARTLESIGENIKALSLAQVQGNIAQSEEHKFFRDKLQELMTKYYYIIIIALITLAVLAGFEKASNLIGL